MRVCGKPGCAACPRILFAVMGLVVTVFVLIALLAVVI